MSDNLQNAPTASNRPAIRTIGALRVLQRTANAISPWVRRWWIGNTPIQQDAQGNASRGVPLALRVQRSVDSAQGGGGALADPFSHAILQRHHNSAEQISRRYRIEQRQAPTTAQKPLPLPGVSDGGRVQRSSGEMSLEELARSFQSSPPLESQSVVQREVDSEFIGTQPTAEDMQDAVRRFSAMRAAPQPSGEGETPNIQRTPEPSPNPSTFSAIEERIRQARQTAAEQGLVPPLGAQPPAASIQRSPADPAQTTPSASGAAPDPGYSIAAQIRERIREARERLAASGGTPAAQPPVQRAPATPPPVQRTPTTPPPVQRTPTPPSRGAWIGQPPVQREPAPPEPGELERLQNRPRELPVEPTTDPSSPGFSIAEAVRERIQRAREANAAAGPRRPLTKEERDRRADPNSPDYSKAEAIRKRIEEARLQRQPMRFSPNPGDPNYSVAEAIRQRIEANRIQRSAASQPAPAPEPPAPSAGPAPFDPSRSIAQQIRERIEAAKARRQGGTPPASPAAPTPPASPSSTETPTPPETPSASAGESIQRTPEFPEHVVMRDLELKPSPLSSTREGPPQAKRVRALSRTQILTPERKTGDFYAGEAPRTPTPPATPSSTAQPSVQRKSDAASASTPPTTPPAQRETPSESAPSTSESSEDGSSAQIQRAATGPPDQLTETLVQRAVEEPSEPAAAISSESTPDTPPVSPAPQTVMRAQTTPESQADNASTGDTPAAPNSPAVTHETSTPAVQRTVESASAPTPQPATSSDVDIVPNANTVSDANTGATTTPEPTAAAEVASSPSAPDTVQRTPERQQNTPPPVPSREVETSPAEPRATVQRSVENAPVEPDVATSQSAATTAPSAEQLQDAPAIPSESVSSVSADQPVAPAIQRSADDVAAAPEAAPTSPAPEAATPAIAAEGTPPAVESRLAADKEASPPLIQRTPEKPVESEPAAVHTPPADSTPPVVQRSVEEKAETPDAPSVPSAPHQEQTAPQSPSERSLDAATPSVLPNIQRTADVTPTTSEPVAPVQRAVDEDASVAASDAVKAAEPDGPSTPAVDNAQVQRAVSESLPAESVPSESVPPEQVQRVPEAHVESTPEPSAANEPPTQSDVVQRSVESSPPVSSSETPAPPKSSVSLVDAIEERIRQAQQRQLEQGSTGEQVQRTPDAEGFSKARELEERIRQAREQASKPAESSTPLVEGATQPSDSTASAIPEPPSSMPSSTVQRKADAPSKSMVDAIEERIRQARQRKMAEGGTPRPSEEAPSQEAATPSPANAPESIQRMPEPQSDSSPAAEPASEATPFRPINRYRDPRVMARAAETKPLITSDMPLSVHNRPGVLPQAREAASSKTLPAAQVQRTLADDHNVRGGRTGAPEMTPAAAQAARPQVQREASPDLHTFAPRPAAAQSSGRQQATSSTTQSSTAQRSSSRSASASKGTSTSSKSTSNISTQSEPTVQRSSLPLAKSRTVEKEVVQRDPTDRDTFVGSTAGMSGRAKTQVEKPDIQKEKRAKSPCEDCDDDSDEKTEAELDRIARAILPVIKRMMAIERDRRNVRPFF